MLFRSRSTIGLDIGSSSVKLVELQPHGSGFRLARFGWAPLPPEAIVQGSFMNRPAISGAIREAYEAGRFKAKDVVTSVSGHAVIVKRITLPSQSAEELEQSIPFEAEQYIPFPIGEVNLDYQVLRDESVDGQMDVLLVAAKRDLIDDYASVISDAGLNLVVMDVDAFALGNTYEHNYEPQPNQGVALINIGASVININVMSGRLPVFTRDITNGGNHYTEEIQKTLGLSFDEAERLKIGEGTDEASKDVIPQEVEETMREVSETLLGEIQRSLDFYRATSAHAPITKLLLCGGSVQVPGLDRLIQERIDSPCERFDPLARIETTSSVVDMDRLHQLAPSLGVAVGLGMRRHNES
jgi:type IV pilus assembly protein PilM